MKRWSYKYNDLLLVFRYGRTSNRKISSTGYAFQTYTFDPDQYEYYLSGNTSLNGILYNDRRNCLDCPFSWSNGYAAGHKCYTHKGRQLVGMTEMLKAIGRKYGRFDDIPALPEHPPDKMIKTCQGKYLRFGSYGEPSLMPFDWVEILARAAKKPTGYTHQWMKEWAQPYRRWFMASTHNVFESAIATDMGWRPFKASKESNDGFIPCPASKERNYKSSCDRCGMCSGTESNVDKPVEIIIH